MYEACGIRDQFPDFERLQTRFFGVSADSLKSHKKFADKFQLPFPLLADVDKEVVNQYEVWGKKSLFGREYYGIKRMSYLIDPAGKIAKIYRSVKPATHANQVLRDRDRLAQRE